MSIVYDKKIMIQVIDEESETWVDLFKRPLHANINKSRSDNEYLRSGAIQSKRVLTFKLRYFKGLEVISGNTQKYRIIYEGVPYNIEDYDDFKLKHLDVTLLGASY